MNGDGTHNKKRIHFNRLVTARGMTPIEKNIIVVDEQGNEYEATYPKRAKGLVKNGRARFIEENKICLACPPNTELEDKNMSENKTAKQEKKNVAVSEQTEQVVPKTLTMEYVLGKIEEISANQGHLMAAITELGKLKSGGPGDVGTQEQGKAFGEIIKAREATNQRLIALYEKMYDDLKPKQSAESERLLMLQTVIESLSEGITPMESSQALQNILQVALQDLSKNV